MLGCIREVQRQWSKDETGIACNSNGQLQPRDGERPTIVWTTQKVDVVQNADWARKCDTRVNEGGQSGGKMKRKIGFEYEEEDKGEHQGKQQRQQDDEEGEEMSTEV